MSTSQSLRKALEAIDPALRLDYLETWRNAPALVKAEAHPRLFVDSGTIDEAAYRMCRYWQYRRFLFGRRMEPLPILAAAENAVLADGFWAVLPSDAFAQPVLLFDARRTMALDAKSRLRIIFWLYQKLLLMNHPRYVLLVLLDLDTQLDDGVQAWVDMIDQCMPILSAAIHMLAVGGHNTALRLHERVLPRALKVFGKLMHEEEVMIAIQPSADELRVALEAFGLSGEGLPAILGGTWSYDSWRAQVAEWWGDSVAGRDEGADLLLHMAAGIVVDHKAETIRGGSPSPGEAASEKSLVDGKSVLTSFTALPDAETSAFNEALSKNRDSVEHEAPLEMFGQNPDGARQLARYWMQRRALFGDDFCWPMTMTGEGALKIKELNHGCIRRLPDSGSGRTTLYIDLVGRGPINGSFLRGLFYMMHAAIAESVRCVRVLLRTMSPEPLPQEFLDVISCFPFQETKVVQCVIDRQSRDDKLSGQQNASKDQNCVSTSLTITTTLYTANSALEMSTHLDSHGFAIVDLPVALGGKFSYRHFAQWQELQIRKEWGLPSGTRCKDVQQMFHFDGAAELSPAESRRRLNIVHTRRVRDRERVQEHSLREELGRLADENERLARENQDMEARVAAVLREARAQVSTDETDMETSTGKRPLTVPDDGSASTLTKTARGRVNAQRRQDRGKQTIAGLTSECDALRSQQRNLIQRNQWMEGLLADSLAKVESLEHPFACLPANDNY